MLFSYNQLFQVANKILLAAGSDAYEAQIVAQHLIEANLKGHDSHGIGMLVNYMQALKNQVLQPNVKLTVVKETACILQVEAKHGYGQRIGKEAIDLALVKAKRQGLCLLTIANSNHLGRIGTYGEQVTNAGLISLHFVNVQDYQPLVAPYAGIDGRFGTNPICISIPKTENNPAIILDFATSIVALGKTRVAWLANKKLTEPAVIDGQGNLTDDPSVMWSEQPGALIPFAKHKGGGLILAAELLAGLLSGGGTVQPGNLKKNVITNNMTSILIDPAHLVSLDFFKHELDAMVDYVKSARQYDQQQKPILIAGEPELIRQAQRLHDGIEISTAEWQALVKAAESVGVTSI